MTVAGRTVGIDVGGTKCLGVALDASGNVVAEDRRPTPRGPGSLPKLIDTLAELAEVLGPYDELGVGVPGLVTHDGVLRAAPNLDGVADFDVAGLLGDSVGHKVHVDNDATCAAASEWLYGAGKGATDMVLVTLGTGIGGGLVAGGKLQRGKHGFAGEYGHIVVDPDGPPGPSCTRPGRRRLRSGARRDGDAGRTRRRPGRVAGDRRLRSLGGARTGEPHQRARPADVRTGRGPGGGRRSLPRAHQDMVSRADLSARAATDAGSGVRALERARRCGRCRTALQRARRLVPFRPAG